jgi:hypothetical protein
MGRHGGSQSGARDRNGRSAASTGRALAKSVPAFGLALGLRSRDDLSGAAKNNRKKRKRCRKWKSDPAASCHIRSVAVPPSRSQKTPTAETQAMAPSAARSMRLGSVIFEALNGKTGWENVTSQAESSRHQPHPPFRDGTRGSSSSVQRRTTPMYYPLLQVVLDGTLRHVKGASPRQVDTVGTDRSHDLG